MDLQPYYILLTLNNYSMVISQSEYPVIVQAFQPSGANELFVAEQVVHNQREADSFTSRYAGLLIKARKPTNDEVGKVNPAYDSTTRRRRSGAGAIWTVLLLLVIALVVVGFTTGWVQRTFNISLN
jgi:hypothetical protein